VKAATSPSCHHVACNAWATVTVRGETEKQTDSEFDTKKEKPIAEKSGGENLKKYIYGSLSF